MSWRTYIDRRVRERFAGNQRALARAVDRPSEEVNRWLRQGMVPRPATAQAVVAALGDAFDDVAGEIYTPDDPIEREIVNSSFYSEEQKARLLEVHRELMREAGQEGPEQPKHSTG